MLSSYKHVLGVLVMFNAIKYFFFFIITQNNELKYEFKLSKLIINIMGIVLSAIFIVLFYYLLERFNINQVLKKNNIYLFKLRSFV